MTIVGKFAYGIRKIFAVMNFLKDCKLKAGFLVSFMDKRHVAIRLFLEEEYNLLWLLENPEIEGMHVRFFKWTLMFSMEAESPMIPVWVTLEKLPIFLFDKEALFEIAKLLGKSIKVDEYTASKSKLSQASIFVEVDVSKTLPKHLWLNIMGKGVAFKVNYDKVPYYCKNCLKLGHTTSHCLATEKSDDELIESFYSAEDTGNIDNGIFGKQIQEAVLRAVASKNQGYVNKGGYIGGFRGRGTGHFQVVRG